MSDRIEKEQIGAKACIEMFRKIGILPFSLENEEFVHPSQLIGIIFEKEILDRFTMDDFTDILASLRGVYSAGGMGCLRSGAETRKNAVLNMMRQICRANGIHLEPHSKSNGYEPNGKKRLKKWFKIISYSDIPSGETQEEH